MSNLSNQQQLSKLARELSGKIRIHRIKPGVLYFNGHPTLVKALHAEAPYIVHFRKDDMKLLLLEVYRQLNVAVPVYQPVHQQVA